jgi:hypothetical protein
MGFDESTDPCCFLVHVAPSAKMNCRKHSPGDLWIQGWSSERVRFGRSPARARMARRSRRPTYLPTASALPAGAWATTGNALIHLGISPLPLGPIEAEVPCSCLPASPARTSRRQSPCTRQTAGRPDSLGKTTHSCLVPQPAQREGAGLRRPQGASAGRPASPPPVRPAELAGSSNPAG